MTAAIADLASGGESAYGRLSRRSRDNAPGLASLAHVPYKDSNDATCRLRTAFGDNVHFTLIGVLTVLGILTGMLGMLEVGRRIGMRRMARDPEGAKAGSGVIDGAVFGLLGLLIAFTFSGAAARFDARRAMIVVEGNRIGTAWLRLDLLPGAAQPALREKFRQYLDARVAAFRKLPDLAAAKTELARANALQTEIWTQAVAACRDSGSQPATMLLLPALNQMFDVASSRAAGVHMRPPLIRFLDVFSG